MNFEFEVVDAEELPAEQPAYIYAQATASKDIRLFRSLQDRDHVLERPEMYIDCVDRSARNTWGFKESGPYMMTTDIPLGLERLFLEATANYCDHACESRENGHDPGEAIVNFDYGYVTMKNYGDPMPIGRHPDTGIHVPESCFGVLKSGSNFTTEVKKVRHGGGANGIGAKACNIMSDEMRIAIENHIEGVYRQRWHTNMTRTKPDVYLIPKPKKAKPGEPGPQPGETEPEPDDPEVNKLPAPAVPITRSSVEMAYHAELYRFGYADGEYPPEALNLFWRHTADASFTAKIPTTFNGYRMNYSSIVDYARLYFEFTDKYILHYEWPEGTEVVTTSGGLQYAKNGILPLAEMIIVDTPNKGASIGFTNCILNTEGGVHVDSVLHAVSDGIIEKLNSQISGAKGKAKGKGKGKGKGKAGASTSSAPAPASDVPKLTIRDVRPHISILVSVRVVDPKFNSQAKTKLRSPTPKIEVPAKTLRQMNDWQLMVQLANALDAKRRTVLVKTDGKKVRFIGDAEWDDANDAGGVNSDKCTLIFMEGDSAKTYGTILVGLQPLGRKRIGLAALRGKLINAYKNTPEDLAKNAELKMIKRALGIEEGVDYRIPANRKKLRYGSIMIMTDADVDGSHIKGLILALFAKLWPSLLSETFIQDYRTPILRATLGKECLCFYSAKEYDDWKSKTPDNKKWTLKYFKGLGNSSKEDVKQDWASPHIYQMFPDNKAFQYMEMAFGPNSADQRKRWLNRPDRLEPLITSNCLNISEFIDYDLKKYSVHTLVRHIPRRDGLQPVNRKAIFAALKRWRRSTTPKECAMVSFVAYVLDKAKYHHGDALSGVIKRMGMEFVGSNNVPNFIIHGGNGTRNEGGKDAAADRYLTIRPNTWWLNLIFRVEDDPILNWLSEGEDQIEPEHYLPTIPIATINGINAVATGHNSFIPWHHPLDVIEYYIERNRYTRILSPQPWVRGHTGDLVVIDRRGEIESLKAPHEKADEPESNSDDDDNDIYDLLDVVDPGDDRDFDIIQQPKARRSRRERYSLVTYGRTEKMGFNNCIVTELPIGLWTKTYKKKLIQRKINKQLDFDDQFSGDTRVYFKITKCDQTDTNGKPRPLTNNDLGLERSYGLTNLVILDDHCRPLRFRTLDDLFNDFFEWRLPFYEKRRRFMLLNMMEKIRELDRRIAFIYAVNNGDLIILQDKASKEPRAEELIYADIERLGLDKTYYKQIRSHQYNKKQVDKLEAERDAIVDKGCALKKTSASQLWINDLIELRDAYIKVYGDDRPESVMGSFVYE